MIKYDGMKAEERNKRSNQLPAGAYVVQVRDAQIEGNEPDQRLAVVFDIAEGPYKGWYLRKFTTQKEKNTDPNRKIRYKGVLRIRIPNPENTKAQYPESDMLKFNDMIAKFKNGNPTVDFYNDDGFDELTQEDEPELTEEEMEERKENHFRLAVGAGNLVAVIGGAVLILLLLTMIFSMAHYVINDMNRNFSLFSTNF